MIKKLISNNLKDSWLVALFLYPKLYLFTILKHVILMGVFTLGLSYFYFTSDYSNIKIPTTTHALISVAIGLLLVFRTQSAYERWTTASQNFYNMKASFYLMAFKLRSIFENNPSEMKQFTIIINDFTKNFFEFLRETDNEKSDALEQKYLQNLETLTNTIRKNISCDSDVNTLYRIVNEIMQNTSSCVRIKQTPIPKSYEMHIKISIFFYILSLPFGFFYDLGIYSVPVVMFIYYIIAGIEIISREIENPFEGTVNDLPINKYLDSIKNAFN